MEEQQALGQLTVVESLGQEQVSHDILVASGLDELAHAHALIGLALLAQSLAESELLDIVKEVLLEVGGGHIVRCVEEGKHILEHAAGRTACRHELHHMVSLTYILCPCGLVCGLVGIRGRHDALLHRGSGLYTQEWETRLYLFELFLYLLFGDTHSGYLTKILFCKHKI